MSKTTKTTQNNNSFYSTYEELKQNLLRTTSVGRRCFYSTYEELKLVSISELEGIRLPRFYSTYEELKQLENTSTSLM